MKKIIIYIVALVLIILSFVLLGKAFKLSTKSGKTETNVAEMLNDEDLTKTSTSENNQEESTYSGIQFRTCDNEKYDIVKYLKTGDTETIKEGLNLNPNVLDINENKVCFYEQNKGLEYIDLKDSEYNIQVVDKFNTRYSSLNSLVYILDNKVYFENNNKLVYFDLNDESENTIQNNIAWNGYYLDKNNKKMYYVQNNTLYNSDLTGENEKIINTGVHLTDENTWLGIINNNLIIECYGYNRSDDKLKKLVFYDINKDSINELNGIYSAVRCDNSIAYLFYDSTTGKSTINNLYDFTNIDNDQEVYSAKYHEEGIKFGNVEEKYERITIIWYDKKGNIVVSIDNGTGISNSGSNIIKSMSLKDKTEKDYTEGQYVRTMLYK